MSESDHIIEQYGAVPNRIIPLGLLKPSPTNPRKRFPPGPLAELAASIKAHGGVTQPILARPNPDYREGNGQPVFEIVAGERRWRASQLAEVPNILALVKELDDRQTLELQLLENIAREDLHPIEEADGIHSLMEAFALGVEDVAAKLGKSERWVALRLALRNLCPDAREACLEGTLKPSIANYIATMPDQAEQARATAGILQGWNGEPFTARQAALYLKKEFMLDLAAARFDIAAVYTVAGPCHDCTKRSGAAPDLFGDAKIGDQCQDSKCFQAKTDEAHQQQLDSYRKAGHQVLQGDAARKLMPAWPAVPANYFRADEPCPQLTSDERQLGDIFGAKQGHFVTVEHPTTRALITIIPAELTKRTLKTKGLLRPAAPPPQPAPEPQAAAPSTAPKPGKASAPAPAAKPVPLSPSQLQNAIRERTGKLFSRGLFALICDAMAQAEEPPLMVLRLLCLERFSDMTFEGLELLRERFPAVPASRTQVKALAELIDVEAMNGRTLAELLAAMLISEELSNDDDYDDLTGYSAFATNLGLHFGVRMSELQDAAKVDAAEQIEAEEDQRLGITRAGDAFAAAHRERADA